MKMKIDIKTHKKKFKVGKFVLYYIFIQTFLFFLGILIFITATVSPFTDNFKNEWNNAYISRDRNFINETIKQYDIVETTVRKCEKSGFYEEKGNLVFCDNKKKFIFKYNNDLNTIITKKKDLIYKFGILSIIFSIIIMLLLHFINNSLFVTGQRINNLSSASKDLVNLIQEMKDYIEKKGSRADYRIDSLEGLTLSVIQHEPDFFHKFGAHIKNLGILSHKNRMNEIRDRLHILYNEMEKTYALKKHNLLKALGLEINLILSKYNTSLLVFVINVIIFLLVSVLILYVLMLLNGGDNISLSDIFRYIINIFTFRESGLETTNIYQQWYLLFLQIFSYILFLIGLKVIILKK